MGLLILLSIWRWKTPYLAPFLFSGIGPLLNGGGYYIVDIFVMKKGDAFDLIRRGVPSYLVLGAGIMLLVAGLYCMLRILGRVGITQQDTLSERAAIICAGILPYFLLALLYTIINAKEDLPANLLAIVMVSFFSVFVAWMSMKLPKWNDPPVNIEWKHVIFAVVLGISAIIIPRFIFPS